MGLSLNLGSFYQGMMFNFGNETNLRGFLLHLWDRGRPWDDGILFGINREICEYCNDGEEVYCDKGITFTFNDVDADGISRVNLTLCGMTFLGLIRDHLKRKKFNVGVVQLLLSQFIWQVSLLNFGDKLDEAVNSAPQLLDIFPLKGVFAPFDRGRKRTLVDCIFGVLFFEESVWLYLCALIAQAVCTCIYRM
ncbi:hypothetical protein I3760_02G063500 [Carya illinoinensis]|nr:hypothetical protein I3760_02G063500 [Carya illinoinensis]